MCSRGCKEAREAEWRVRDEAMWAWASGGNGALQAQGGVWTTGGQGAGDGGGALAARSYRVFVSVSPECSNSL